MDLSIENVEKCIIDGEIEIVPVSVMRGRNFTNCLVVIDEAQNLTDTQTELLLTRICNGSKMIFCGDAAQIDLKDRKHSGFDVVSKHMKEVPGFEVITLEKNHRHEIVEPILEVYKNLFFIILVISFNLFVVVCSQVRKQINLVTIVQEILRSFWAASRGQLVIK